MPFTSNFQEIAGAWKLAAIIFALMITNEHQHKLDDTDHKTLPDALETSLRTM